MNDILLDEYLSEHEVTQHHLVNNIFKDAEPLVEFITYGNEEGTLQGEKVFRLQKRSAKKLIEQLAKGINSDFKEWTYDETWLIYRLAQNFSYVVFEKNL